MNHLRRVLAKIKAYYRDRRTKRRNWKVLRRRTAWNDALNVIIDP